MCENLALMMSYVQKISNFRLYTVPKYLIPVTCIRTSRVGFHTLLIFLTSVGSICYMRFNMFYIVVRGDFHSSTF